MGCLDRCHIETHGHVLLYDIDAITSLKVLETYSDSISYTVCTGNHIPKCSKKSLCCLRMDR